ncbi:hypothetical protein ACP70R_010221 [Stipagrostis hirtigluma subsp. patula]
MTLDALCTPGSDVLIYDTFDAAACATAASAGSLFSLGDTPLEAPVAAAPAPEGEAEGGSRVQQGRRKRRRRARSVKSREDAESQRMTHIAVERNRRRQMNEYLAALRSLMPESYVHRGDQASVVSGAIDYVKELEQQLQSLEAHKALLMARRRQRNDDAAQRDSTARPAAQTPATSGGAAGEVEEEDEEAAAREEPPLFARFFRYPQYVWRHHAQALPRWEDGGAGAEEDRASGGSGAGSGVADIEVSVVVDAHATLRVMAPRRPGQLLGMVAGMQALGLAVLHLSAVTAADSLALYTLSLKVEEGCGLTTADDIAAAAHHVLCIIGADETTTVAAQQLLASG